jgi:hypothetical protein
VSPRVGNFSEQNWGDSDERHQHAAKQRWQQLLTAALPADIAATVVSSPAYGALIAALRRAEHDGLNIDRALPALAAAAPLRTDDREMGRQTDGVVRDPAAVLHYRVTNWHSSRIGNRPGATLLAGHFTPAGATLATAEPELRDAILDIETRIAHRSDAVTRQVLDTRPSWLRRLGPEPADHLAHTQ